MPRMHANWTKDWRSSPTNFRKRVLFLYRQRGQTSNGQTRVQVARKNQKFVVLFCENTIEEMRECQKLMKMFFSGTRLPSSFLLFASWYDASRLHYKSLITNPTKFHDVFEISSCPLRKDSCRFRGLCQFRTWGVKVYRHRFQTRTHENYTYTFFLETIYYVKQDCLSARLWTDAKRNKSSQCTHQASCHWIDA